MPKKTRVSKRKMDSPLSRSDFDTFKKDQGKAFATKKKKTILKKASPATIAKRKATKTAAKKAGVSTFTYKTDQAKKKKRASTNPKTGKVSIGNTPIKKQTKIKR